ncbi:regulation of enolase protein 1 (concanavalin A-like superfamily) [Robbsia andropogonis]
MVFARKARHQEFGFMTCIPNAPTFQAMCKTWSMGQIAMPRPVPI